MKSKPMKWWVLDFRRLPLPSTERQNISKSFNFQMAWNKRLTHWISCVETQNPSDVQKLHLINGERLKNRNLKVFRLLNPSVVWWRKSLKFISLFIIKLARELLYYETLFWKFQRSPGVECPCWRKRQEVVEVKKTLIWLQKVPVT